MYLSPEEAAEFRFMGSGTRVKVQSEGSQSLEQGIIKGATSDGRYEVLSQSLT